MTTHDFRSKFDEKMNSSAKNVKSYLFNDHPLLDNKCDYAIIVEVEDDGKTARVDAVYGDGMEIASLISRITPGGHVEESRINGGYSIEEGQDITELVDELREYLPEKFTKWMKSEEL
ncbi:MAG: hypothetical protein Q8N63_02860 [Nanoarchaeota archaeon]|nr:hypothetical protein [Nanoarchaeota archaeon]